jgi:hypothetical protein
MDESTLAAKMMEVAQADMKRVKGSGSFGENPNWGKSQSYLKKQKQGGKQGRPTSCRAKIFKCLEKDMTTTEIVAELGYSRSTINQYKRKWRLQQNAASSHAA